jgi:hypothetical protein
MGLNERGLKRERLSLLIITTTLALSSLLGIKIHALCSLILLFHRVSLADVTVQSRNFFCHVLTVLDLLPQADRVDVAGQ